jgi:hypothetical protein
MIKLFLYNSGLTKGILPSQKDVWTCRHRRTKYNVLASGAERIWSRSYNCEKYWGQFGANDRIVQSDYQVIQCT